MSLASQGWVRKTGAVAIFLLAAMAQVFFKDVPWPINVESNESTRHVSAALAAQEIVISGATVSPHHAFLTYQGNAFETVDFDLGRAELGKSTASLLASFAPGPPTGPNAWHVVSHEDNPLDTGETCRSFLDIELADQHADSNEFHVLQLGASNMNHMRHIEIRTDDAPLELSFKTEWPFGRENKALGCQKRLQSGTWFRGIVNHPLQFIVSPHSSIQIDFISTSVNSPSWGGPDKPFRSAELGPLLARSVTVRPIQEDGTVLKQASPVYVSAYRDSQLKIADLEIGPDNVQLSMSGKGWAQVNGKAQGLDLWGLMEKNALFAALLTSGNALLLTWLRSLFLGKQPNQEGGK